MCRTGLVLPKQTQVVVPQVTPPQSLNFPQLESTMSFMSFILAGRTGSSGCGGWKGGGVGGGGQHKGV